MNEISSIEATSLPHTVNTQADDASASAMAIPLAKGMDSAAFDFHYQQVRREKKQQWLQKAFSAWHFYGEPLGMGLFPGKLYADLFLSPDVGFANIAFLSCCSALVIAPWWIRHRQLHNQHKRFYIFYVVATERCITQGGL